ncbi:MAG: diguanylate cyclase [Pseudomonadota bacterium]
MTRQFALLLAAALVYFALARFGMAIFSLKPSNITLLWLPSGIALVMCLQWGTRALPFIAVASFLANVDGMAGTSISDTVLHTSVAAITDTLTGFAAARLFRGIMPEGLQRTVDLLPFIFWVCLVPTLLSSVVLTINLVMGGYIPQSEFGSFVRMLVLADSLGILLVYPMYQSWRSRKANAGVNWRAKGLAAFSIGVLLFASSNGIPGMEFFLIPVLLILSFHVGMFSLTTMGTLTLVCVFAASARHSGPFTVDGIGDAGFRMVAFAFSSALTILGVALQRGQLEMTERTRQIWQDAAEHDLLTGLPNRRVFLPKVQLEHQRTLRSGKIYTIAMLDLDHFKDVNDTYGHHGGDLVLSAFANLLLENCRQLDTVARVGGEEFAILLPECEAESARVMLDRMRNKLAALSVMIDKRHVSVTVSIGIATYCVEDGQTANAVTRADLALYRAKQAGRNCIVLDGAATGPLRAA